MKKLILIVLMLTFATACSGQFKDTLKSVYIVDTFKVESGILVSRDGTGLIPFRNITTDQLKYLFELISYFEKGNQLKKFLEKR